MLYRAIQYTNPNNNLDTASLTKFSDNAQVSNWAKDAMSSVELLTALLTTLLHLKPM